MKRLIKRMTGLEVTDTAATAVVIIFAMTIAIGFLMLVGSAVFALLTGKLIVDEEVQTQVWRLLTLALLGLGPLINALLHRKTSEINQQKTVSRVDQLELRLDDSLGDKLALKTADKVAEQVAELKVLTDEVAASGWRPGDPERRAAHG